MVDPDREAARALAEPLGAEAARILPEGRGLWDTGPIMFHCRRDAEGRLILGTMGRALGSGAVTRRWAERQVRRIFPDLGPVESEHVWDGRIAMTSDHLPRICELAPGVWTPIAYNGRGITTRTLFGQAMAGLLTGTDAAALPLPVTRPAPESAARLRSRLLDLAFSANQIVRSL